MKEKEKEKEPGAQPGHRDAHGHTVKISEKALRLKAEEEARQKEADELNRLLDEKLVRCRLNTEPTIVRSAGPMASANAACRWDQFSAQPWFTEFAYRWTAHYSRYSRIALFGGCQGPNASEEDRRIGKSLFQQNALLRKQITTMEARLLEMAKIDRPFARAFALRWGFFWTSLRLSLRAIFVAARFGRGLAVEVGI